jgi:co-chaperonin GroES (HSP10)
VSGVRIGNETVSSIAESERIRPLRDTLLVEPLEWNASKVIWAAWHGKTIRGRVLDVGPGVYPKRYNGGKGQRTKSWDSKAFRPCDVKKGDVVHLGGLELGGYLHTTVRWGNKTVVVCREEDVAGIES